jgi:subtilisin family serine protease
MRWTDRAEKGTITRSSNHRASMKTRKQLLTFASLGAVIALGTCVVACASGGGCSGVCSTPPPTMGPTSPPTSPPGVGCNANPTSLTAVGEPETLMHRPVFRGTRPAYIPGLIAVKFSGTGAEAPIAQSMARIGAQVAGPRNEFGYVTYTIPPTANAVVAAASLAGTRGILEAKPISARYTEVVPDDQYFGVAPPYTGPDITPVQWDMYYTQMPAAWDISEGSPGVRIAVIDTGYDANNIDICSKVVGSAVFDLGTGNQDTSASPQDDDGHGSDVSGIAASVTNNVTRFAGVGWNVDLLEVRVFKQATTANPNPPGASSQDIAAGINWAVAHGARVINMSLGSTPGAPCDAGEQTAINNAVAANVAVVVAAGNDSSNVFGDPADCNGVVVAGASALDDTSNPAAPKEKTASYTDYNNNNTWGLVAPGSDPDAAQLTCGTAPKCDFLQWIFNAYSTTACCASSTPPNGGSHQVLIAGTSMAAPHVAGVAALMISKDAGITPAQIANILKANADDICGGCDQEGAGRLDAAKALVATP